MRLYFFLIIVITYYTRERFTTELFWLNALPAAVVTPPAITSLWSAFLNKHIIIKTIIGTYTYNNWPLLFLECVHFEASSSSCPQNLFANRGEPFRCHVKIMYRDLYIKLERVIWLIVTRVGVKSFPLPQSPRSPLVTIYRVRIRHRDPFCLHRVCFPRRLVNVIISY